jgi:hypothetical protein
MAENPNYQMGISHSANEFAKWKKIRIKAGMKSKPNYKSAFQSIYFLGAISGYSLQVRFVFVSHEHASRTSCNTGFSLLSGALNR